MKNKIHLLSLILSLHVPLVAQEFFPGEIYFKLTDNYPILLDLYPEDSVNIEAQIPFFVTLIDAFQVSSVKREFYFTTDDKLIRTFRVRCADFTNLDDFINEISLFSEVEYAEKVPIHYADYVPNDLGSNTLTGQWNLHKIDAQTAWDYVRGDPSIIVAIVDDAFEIANNELNDVMVPGYDIPDSDTDPTPVIPLFNHGTHVAGIVGAETDNNSGIASIGFGISIMPVKATPDHGIPGYIYTGYSGIAWAAAQGAKVINCSWDGSTYRATGQNTVNYAWNQGAVIVAAAGNEGDQALRYPASYLNVVSVASTNINDHVSTFSTRNAGVDVSAPGEGILSLIPFNGFAVWDGTSMAAPLVSGLLGLMLSANPTMTNVDLVNCLISTTDNINSLNPSNIGLFGSGRINAYKALICAMNIHPCPSSRIFISPAYDFSATNMFFEASQTIEARNKITGTATIDYDAGISIKLMPGFYAKTSNYFKALIDGCGGIQTAIDHIIHEKEPLTKLYPNPNDGTFSIELPAPLKGEATLKIISATGQVIVEDYLERGSLIHNIEAPSIPSGFYVIQIITGGQVLSLHKFVKL